MFSSNMLRAKLVILIIISPHLVLSARILPIRQSRKAFMMEYFENCDGKLYPIMLRNYSFIRNGSTLLVNGEDVVSRDLKDPIELQFRIEKCADRSNLEACQHFTTLKWKDWCTTVIFLPVFRGFLQDHNPPMPCPLKKNHYYLKNVPMQLDSLAAFLTQGNNTKSLLKVRTLVLEGSQIVSCSEGVVRIADVRVRV